MGNSVVRQTVFRGSCWTKQGYRRYGADIIDVETAQPPEERRKHRAVEEEYKPLDTTVADAGREHAVGHQLVGSYYTVWYNNPEDVCRYYTEDAVYSVIDGTRYEAKGQTQIRELFDNLEEPETRNEKNDDGGDCRSVIVQLEVMERCPSSQLLVVADDGDVHAILRRRVHRAWVVRRDSVSGNGETRWRRSTYTQIRISADDADAAVTE
ncbi:adenosine kinase-like [Aphis craccivora]|uniref:Adenosine kinase-like n=1 Tax=Aphis craccivora TaxID=307492 RepID=A0A6G0ZQT4_APHCR|nr:adenosine kinase-like [Aphis craccivora]